ncbi:MAG: metal-dependent transcriptional regulator [Planctomycetes bacterium]|nr:metal-dependent transcriptional regulator [Planctomycetota bacterium]
MPSLTVENYLKAIYTLCHTTGQPATTGAIAQALDVSPGTVTSMLKTLADAGLATYTPYSGAELTRKGQALALHVVRRHRLIELFLVKTLNLTWDEVHAEAEHMEHAVSDLLIDRIDTYLGRPKVDPHGDPIPSHEGKLDEEPSSQSLADCATGDSFTLVRVLDQSPEFLRFLTEAGLTIGTSGKVLSNRAESGVVKISSQGHESTLGSQAAQKILVTIG